MDTLLDELIPLLQWHADRKGESLDDWFNRQLHERVARKRLEKLVDGWARVRLSDDDVSVSEEWWDLDDFKHFEDFHPHDKPNRADEAVTAFRGWGHTVLIDGQKRVNYWRKKQVDGEHRVFVVTPRVDRANPFPGAPAPDDA